MCANAKVDDLEVTSTEDRFARHLVFVEAIATVSLLLVIIGVARSGKSHQPVGAPSGVSLDPREELDR